MHSAFSSSTIRIVPAVLYVDQHITGGSGDGGRAGANAFSDLQPALIQSVAGQTIRVADGTYKPTSTTDRSISFELKSGVAIFGGYAGYAATDPDAHDVVLYRTILSGDIGTRTYVTDNSYHVVVARATDATAVLDGSTIIDGQASGHDSYGGGLYGAFASPTIRNCTFSSNRAGRSPVPGCTITSLLRH